MSKTNRFNWGHRVAGALVGLALLAGACSDGSGEPLTADGDAASVAPTTAEGAAGTEAAADGSDGTALTLPAAGDSTTDGGSDGSAAPDDTSPAAQPAGPWDELAFTLLPVGSLAQPTTLAARPGSDDLWLAERVGRVRLIERTLDDSASTETLVQSTNVVLDISDQVDTGGEGGLLGMAFSADGGNLYVHYTDREFFNVISEFPIGATTADAAAERILLRIEQPFSNHNGGDLHFGPDGLLYAGIGDGGSADDPLGSGQDTSTLLGTILRIDPTPSASAGYTIPPDNPFAAGGGAPEIWSWGLRNPWRFSFDPITGDLWIGDVGQNRFEEVNFVPGPTPGRGANFGWNLVEGNDRFAGDPPPGHTPPIYTYSHDGGRCSITGGHVYRGPSTPELSGVYVFADLCSGEVFGLQPQADGVKVAPLLLDRIPENVIGFGQGHDGEVYVLEQGGRISRIQPADLALETTISSG